MIRRYKHKKMTGRAVEFKGEESVQAVKELTGETATVECADWEIELQGGIWLDIGDVVTVDCNNEIIVFPNGEFYRHYEFEEAE